MMRTLRFKDAGTQPKEWSLNKKLIFTLGLVLPLVLLFCFMNYESNAQLIPERVAQQTTVVFVEIAPKTYSYSEKAHQATNQFWESCLKWTEDDMIPYFMFMAKMNSNVYEIVSNSTSDALGLLRAKYLMAAYFFKNEARMTAEEVYGKACDAFKDTVAAIVKYYSRVGN